MLTKWLLRLGVAAVAMGLAIHGSHPFTAALTFHSANVVHDPYEY